MDEVAFGRYRLIELLGRGGMGDVWRAHDTATNRNVAIKLLSAHLAQDELFVQRFRREAEAAARLNSPHVIPIHDYGEIDGRLFVNMRLVEGRDLQEVLTDGRLEPARAVRIIEQVAKALHAAHKIGLIHRDVKPSNILLDDDDFAYLIDFGIARALDDTRLTNTGSTIGTFQYMAPERLGENPEEDSRADIYALACVLYQCLTGSPPFPGHGVERLVVAHLHTPPPQPSRTQPDMPEALDEVIATGMAKDPDNRYATAVELAAAAHDAITIPTHQPAPPPTRPSTDAAREANQPTQPPIRQHVAPPAAVEEPAATMLSSLAQGPATPGLEPAGERLPTQPLRPHPRWRRPAIMIPATLLTVAVIVVAIIFGIDSGRVLSTQQTNTSDYSAPGFDLSQCKTGADANKYVQCRVVATGNSVDAVWHQLMPSYTRPHVRLFTNQVNTGCGTATTAVGPFYCPVDQTAYFDTDFLQELVDKFGSSGGPFAQEYVVAHEYGHHVQNLLGVLGRAQQGAQGAGGNGVRTELQADCYAGIWAHYASTTKQESTGVPYLNPLTDKDIADALSAAASVGDDRIQQETAGKTNPESWRHGSSEQRKHWFTVGYQTGQPKDCDTFNATSLG